MVTLKTFYPIYTSSSLCPKLYLLYFIFCIVDYIRHYQYNCRIHMRICIFLFNISLSIYVFSSKGRHKCQHFEKNWNLFELFYIPNMNWWSKLSPETKQWRYFIKILEINIDIWGKNIGNISTEVIWSLFKHIWPLAV